jgi:hypothetical protein
MKTSSHFANNMTRRGALKGLAATSALAALPMRAHAQETTLRWWSPQGAPAQVEAYQFQIAQFEAANPGIKVVFETTSDEGYAPQLAAAFSSGEVPDIVTHLPSFAVQTYYANGLIEPFDDVIAAIGADDFYPGANDVFRTADGTYCGTGIGNSAANMLWLRTDLMAEAGLDKAPETWDELRAAVQAMQKGGIYGAPLPYGRNSMTSLIFIGFIHQAGGQVFTPDLQVAIDNEGTRNALEFYREMKDYCPPGATNYSWGESLTAFVSGATATGHLHRPRARQRARPEPGHRRPHHLPHLSRASRPTWRPGRSTTSPASSSRRSRRTSMRRRHSRPSSSTRKATSSSSTRPRATCCRCSVDQREPDVPGQRHHPEIPRRGGAHVGGRGGRLQPRLRVERAPPPTTRRARSSPRTPSRTSCSAWS